MTDVNDIEAAKEYARRMRKGLPEDRWTDGVDGAFAVARGIEVLWDNARLLMLEREARGLASMEPSADPMRND